MMAPQRLHVAAGVVFNGAGEVLIARRDERLHQGGLWEFPGGKVEAGETVEQALRRELREELAIDVERSEPLIRIRHAYPECDVVLDVFRVERFGGTPRGLLGQPFRWVPPESLPQFDFPAANRPIITAARLPDRYGIVDVGDGGSEDAFRQLRAFARAGISLVRLRAKTLPEPAYCDLAQRFADFCREQQVRLMLDGCPELVRQLGVAGVHLDSAELKTVAKRPVGTAHFFAVSCHDVDDLARAEAVGADFALLSPVLPTASHPQVQPMGWRRFADLAEGAGLPVYALGGMYPEHREVAKRFGAQGIAGIRGLAGR